MASSSANNEKSSFLDREKRHKVKISCLKSLKKWWCWILIIIVLVCCIAIPMIMMLLGKTLKCPLFHSNYWICPDGSKVNIPDALMSTHHVNQSYLVKQIEAACRPTFPDFCERKNQTFLQIFREGDCSGGLAGDMADGPFLAACKTHDVCYTLQRGQQACDEEFCSNLKNSCNWTLSSSREEINYLEFDSMEMHTGAAQACQSNSFVVYNAVHQFGSTAYDWGGCPLNKK